MNLRTILEILSFFQMNPILIFLLLVWHFYWKGRALWKAAKNKDLIWFIVLLVINTLGILEILYIFLFNGKKKKA